MLDDNVHQYFSGKKLYGDDFSIEQIMEWYEDEKDAYFNLGAKNRDNYKYGYHALNYSYGFRFLGSKKRFSRVLSIGGAYGDELSPIKDRIDQITILESSIEFFNDNPNQIRYEKALPTGEMPFPDNCFDLITCFGTLHHIPNVSKIINEIYRCTRVGGYTLIREPIVSMGDWRESRKGLTKRERGIPIHMFREFINSAGYKIVEETKCMFSLTSRLRYIFDPVYNSNTAVMIDKLFCMLFGWNTTYHATNPFSKLRPTSIFYILQK